MDNICGFCSTDEGSICSGCVQKVLLMDLDKLKQAYALAQERGFTEKAEIIGSYLEEIDDENQSVERSSVGSRRVRSLRHEEKLTRQAAKDKRLPVRQAH